jgi:hypothetical protein
MRSHRRNARRIAATTVASGLLAAGALALTTSAASAATIDAHRATAYSFRTIDDPKDLTFNQLLGINNSGEIAGYFGSGAQGHPNKGYVIPPFSQTFVNENFPGSVQTQVTGYTVGSGSSAVMHGFTWTPQGGFRTVDDPHGVGTTTINGVNDAGQVVGFYVDSNGNTDGFLASPLH